MAGESIEVIMNPGESGGTEYVFLREGQSDKVQISLGVIQSFQELETAVTRFNRSHDDVRIGIVTYYDPIVKERFEAAMEQAKEAVYSSSVEGKVKIPQMTYMDEDTNIEVYEATQADIDAMKSLIERADSKFKYHTEIQKIIDEEAAYFLNGQKGMDEVTGLIQNRVELLLNTNVL